MDNDKYIGRLLDNRYEILEVIGVGGMAVVYKARCHRLNRLVAIKILKDDYCQDEEFRRRFHAEGQAVAMVSHPNIVSVYDVSSSQDADFIVMELIDGISLKQYMEKKGILNWKETLHFAMQIGKALEHAHSKGIVHRDIKPHNIMVLKNGSVKVADFGIARVMSESHTLTREALGSVHYISPEQAKGGRVDDRSDIYSLGVVMYEMIAGRPPYNGESPVAVAIQHINGGAKMPSTLNPNIPGGLEQIIMKAMALEPAGRYDSAAAMLADMDEFRKAPGILFGYSTPVIDSMGGAAVAGAAVTAGAAVSQARSATGPIRTGNTGRTGPVRTSTASAQSNTGRRTAAQMSAIRAVQKNAEKAAQARRGVPSGNRRPADDEDERSKAATIAIIVCSLVAVIAIVIFLVTLFGGGENTVMVSVPTLLGKHYDSLQIDENFVLAPPNYEYDSVYEKGHIIFQSPDAGTKVNAGTTINITISLGQMPQVKTMENLVGQERTIAENFLTGQGLLYLCMEESSDTVAAGLVTRTDPAEGQELTDGQTVKLYISTGPAIQKIQMPDLVKRNVSAAEAILDMQGITFKLVKSEEESLDVEAGSIIRTEPASGETVETGDTITIWVSTGPKKVKMPNVVGKDINAAKELLDYAGFINVDFNTYVDSDAPENQVVTQSVKANEEVAINTKIVLELSKGPTEPPQVEKTVNFALADGMLEVYQVTITRMDTGEVVYNGMVSPETPSLELTLKGSGKVTFEIKIGDTDPVKQEVVFN